MRTTPPLCSLAESVTSLLVIHHLVNKVSSIMRRKCLQSFAPLLAWSGKRCSCSHTDAYSGFETSCKCCNQKYNLKRKETGAGGGGKKPLNHIFLSKHTIIGAVCRTAIKYRKEENQPRGELAFSMTIWHRRRRRGTKASWMDRRGECAIALTCKWGFVTELKLPDPLYPLPKKKDFFPPSNL